MNLADSVILILVVLIVVSVIVSALKKRREAHQNRNMGNKCSGCAYKGFCGKLPKE